jgi:hypothetical protein
MSADPSGTGSDLYGAYYYAHGCGRPYQRDQGWLDFFGGIAERIVSGIQPESVLDAGCAWGFLVEGLRQRGVQAFGVDVSEYAIGNVHESIKPYCWVGSVAEPFPRTYDLITCIEVLEHMPREQAEQAVENLCRHTGDVLFSSTPFDYKEATHFNVQPPEYWAELFARQGFFRDVDYDAAFLTPWAVRFRRSDEPLPRRVRAYERKFFLLWKENADLRSLTGEMRDELVEHSDQLAGLRANLISGEQKIQELSAQVEEQEQLILELEARKDHPLVFVLARVYRLVRRVGRFVLDRLRSS